jgi:predicted Zn-dependent protease
MCARINVLNKRYDSALSYYTSLPGILQWSPRIITETATALSYAGKDDDAIQRVSLLHKHGIYTKQSLEIFRDIAFKMNLLEKSAAAQQLLEKKYGTDINIKWHRLLLALKEEKIESAETTVNELLQLAPGDERFITAKFSILFLKKEYDAIIDQLPSSGLSPEKIKPLEAMAWLKSGDTTKAITSLESGIAITNDIQLMTELAQLYIHTNKPDNAALVYKKIIDHTSSDKIDSIKTAAILNNYAWVLSTSEGNDLTTALDAARKAYDLAPDNIHILDTYASILLKSKKFKECISLLNKNKNTTAQGRLLCHLANAYEQASDLNKAIRYYEDAIKTNGPDQLPLTMSKEMIQEHIKQLFSNKS